MSDVKIGQQASAKLKKVKAKSKKAYRIEEARYREFVRSIRVKNPRTSYPKAR